LAELKKPENLDTYLCEKCFKNSCIKSTSEIKFGKHLLLRINRFNRFGDKLSDTVKFPTSFEIEGKSINLIAYGVHLGDTIGLHDNDYVHYKAHVKSFDETWIEIDDNTVRTLS
jgi:ubiquitin C-terminal hydrolase